MVVCAAYGCPSRSGTNKITFHGFPKDLKYKKLWCERLRRGQPGHRTKLYEPNIYSKLCALHFEEDQYICPSDSLLLSVGFSEKFKKVLKTDALPTIFPDCVKLPKEKRQRKSAAKIQQKKSSLHDTSILPATSSHEEEHFIATPLQSNIRTDTNISVECAVADTDPGCAATSTSGMSSAFEVQTQTSYNLVPRRSFAVQCAPKLVSVGTQTETDHKPTSFIEVPVMPPFSPVDTHLEESMHENSRDQEWVPNLDIESESECDLSEPIPKNEANEEKYIVYKSCLEQLLEICQLCGNKCYLERNVVGTCVSYKKACITCDSVCNWSSQPYSRTMPFGNLIMAAAILFSGLNIHQCLRMFKFCGIAFIGKATYLRVQQAYLVPAIRSVWQQKQASYIEEVRSTGQQLKLGGDGRCCSPGHTAKFGTYSLMDLEKRIIVDIQLVQSNEVPNSYGMEKEGLIRALTFLKEENGLVISDLVTDRHSAIKNFVRDEHPDIKHWFDVWHVAKGIHKKLIAAGKKKDCEKVTNWARSVSNHLYWCAASSDGDSELVKQKWLSILNHVTDQHEGHGTRFPKCAHENLETDRDWMEKDRKPHVELKKVVASAFLLRDIGQLSPAEQTSSLESFHKVICAFAPKFLHYFHAQMEARVYLAALHFNENSTRAQRQNRRGELQFSVSYPRGRNGEGTVKQLKIDMTFGYVEELMEEVLLTRELRHTYAAANRARAIEEPSRPVPLCQSTPKRRKIEIVENHFRRFNR